MTWRARPGAVIAAAVIMATVSGCVVFGRAALAQTSPPTPATEPDGQVSASPPSVFPGRPSTPASAPTSLPPSALAEPTTVVAPDPLKGLSPATLNGQISGQVALNAGDFQAITLKGASTVYLVSGNGRYWVSGTLHDAWQGGRELTSLDDIRQGVQTVDVRALLRTVDVFAPFRIGSGPRQEIVFLDPYCPYCRLLLSDIAARGDDHEHQYIILPIALLGANSVRAVRNLQCAADRDAALRALLTHSYAPALPEVANCDLAPVEKRAIFARLLQIRGVPSLIRHDGRRQDGLPGDFAAWLREAPG
jgi:thiol:disulfide interchange protein DsbC